MQILLCTDGLWESLSTDEFIECIAENNDIETTAESFLNTSLEKWGKDNISLILFQVIDLE
jgi:serine/threonine protein phosphatase PrpC